MSQNKILRYSSIEAVEAFEKEATLIQQVKDGDLSQALMLWQCKSATLVLPSGRKWPKTDALEQALNTLGWQLVARQTGGAPVPQQPGIINLSHIYRLDDGEAYDIKQAYLELCDVLIHAFRQLGIDLDVHATPGSYCDGDYNLNIKSRKLVGTAQRVLLNGNANKIVLAQACIIVDAACDLIVKPVQLTNDICNNGTDIRAEAHTSLAQHLPVLPSVNSLYQTITAAFLQKAKPRS